MSSIPRIHIFLKGFRRVTWLQTVDETQLPSPAHSAQSPLNVVLLTLLSTLRLDPLEHKGKCYSIPLPSTGRVRGWTTRSPRLLHHETLQPSVCTKAPKGRMVCSLSWELPSDTGGTTRVPPLVLNHSSLESPARVTPTLSRSFISLRKGTTACVAPLSNKGFNLLLLLNWVHRPV